MCEIATSELRDLHGDPLCMLAAVWPIIEPLQRLIVRSSGHEGVELLAGQGGGVRGRGWVSSKTFLRGRIWTSRGFSASQPGF